MAVALKNVSTIIREHIRPVKSQDEATGHRVQMNVEPCTVFANELTRNMRCTYIRSFDHNLSEPIFWEAAMASLSLVIGWKRSMPFRMMLNRSNAWSAAAEDESD